jgi:hypothetical protein
MQISYGCSFMTGEKAFRVPWGLQMLPAVVLGIGLLFLPESPRWLARHDRWEETHAVLTHVHGHGDPNSPFVKLEMDEIRQMIDFERQNADVTFMELFKPNMINRLHIGIFTQIWSQLTGMNVMMCKFYNPFSPSLERLLTTHQTTSPTSSAWLVSPETLVSSPPRSNTSSTCS